jgi:hypothetical protein
MNDNKATATPQAVTAAGHKSWERVLLGDDSIRGTLRLIGYMLGFVLVFGTLFYLFG